MHCIFHFQPVYVPRLVILIYWIFKNHATFYQLLNLSTTWEFKFYSLKCFTDICTVPNMKHTVSFTRSVSWKRWESLAASVSLLMLDMRGWGLSGWGFMVSSQYWYSWKLAIQSDTPSKGTGEKFACNCWRKCYLFLMMLTKSICLLTIKVYFDVSG